MVSPVSNGAARALFPSLGYFGSTEADCLVVPIGERIRYLKLTVHDGAGSVLNLRSLRLVNGGSVIELAEGRFEVRQSSVFPALDSRPRDALLRGAGVHTDVEPSPSWELLLADPTPMDAAHVFNRVDRWGGRSRSLTIHAETSSGAPLVLYDGSCADRMLEHVLQLAPLVRGSDSDPAPTSLRGDALRRRWTSLIANRLLAGDASLEPPLADALFAIVPFYDADELTDDECTVLATAIHIRSRGRHSVDVRGFSRCLGEPARIQRLADSLDRVASAFGEPSVRASVCDETK